MSDDPVEPWLYQDALKSCERAIAARDTLRATEEFARMDRLEKSVGYRTWQIPDELREQRRQLEFKLTEVKHGTSKNSGAAPSKKL